VLVQKPLSGNLSTTNGHMEYLKFNPGLLGE